MKYQLFCSQCGYKRFTKGDDVQDLVAIKQSSVQRKIPYIDPDTKKTINVKHIEREKLFKCPQCGYSIKAFKLKLESNNEQQINRTDGSQTSLEG